MSKELTARQKALQAARQDFVRAANHATNRLTRDRDRLRKQLKRVNTRMSKVRADLIARAEKLAKSSRDSATKRLNEQIGKLKKIRAAALKEAKSLRADLALVREDLAHATEHLTEAVMMDKAMAKAQKDLHKVRSKKTKKKRVTRKKTVAGTTRRKTRKKAAAKKTATARHKKTSVRKKRAA